jgi:signal transduction histidine kinase/CheY-like chemotaxis protein
MSRIVLVEIQNQRGVVAARQRAREIAALLGFDALDQTRIATAVSEIARNAVEYGKDGTAEFSVEGKSAPQSFSIRIIDKGRGISNLQDILEGNYRSQTGLGVGIAGSRRLVDRLEIESKPGSGTTVSLFKSLPAGSGFLRANDLAKIAEELASRKPTTAVEELETQNRELFSTLDQLRNRTEELARVNHELEDTNRGVVALYAELDEKANHLRRADELKSRFLSNMSHEFRTPVYSTVSICKMLIERYDGDLTGEQERQVRLILRAQEGLAELVNDLLDLAKLEAGKTKITPSKFALDDVFSALRGMFRPLLTSQAVALVFEEPGDVPLMTTDEGKVSQILRNFISNALKFTEQGEVRVSAGFDANKDEVLLAVSDTGVGIATEDQARIFEEFSQVDNYLQRKVKGTGLGLPLSRKLCELLGGAVFLQSELGQGSTFYARIPRLLPELRQTPAEAPVPPALDRLKFPVLAIDDSAEAILLYEKHLKRSAFQLIPVQTVAAAKTLIGQFQPAAILLDLAGGDGQPFLTQLKEDPLTRDVPTLAARKNETAPVPGADGYFEKPADRKSLLAALNALVKRQSAETVLLIDDEEISRYVVAQLLAETRYTVLEATDGEEGIRRARGERPHAIFLDLNMPGMPGDEVLRILKSAAETKEIPVIIHTSKILSEDEKKRLSQDAVAILSKGEPPEEIAGRIRQLLMSHAQKVKP